jgi:membrane protease YdiL (CAAX protease family)
VSPGNPAVAALAVFVAYTVLVGVLWRLTGTRYDHLVDSRSTILRGIVLPIGLGGLLLAVMTTWFGWWESALLPGASGPSWALVVPLLFAVVAVLNIASIDWRSAKARLLPLLLLGTALVGFAEELASRGQLAVGLRESGASEVTVWLVTSILFALLHGMNVLFGQSGRTTLLQIVAAFFAGTVLYITMMTTGSLIVAMVLHALWDFGTLGILATDRQQKPVAGILALATFLIAAGTVGFVLAAA